MPKHTTVYKRAPNPLRMWLTQVVEFLGMLGFGPDIPIVLLHAHLAHALNVTSCQATLNNLNKIRSVVR